MKYLSVVLLSLSLGIGAAQTIPEAEAKFLQGDPETAVQWALKTGGADGYALASRVVLNAAYASDRSGDKEGYKTRVLSAEKYAQEAIKLNKDFAEGHVRYARALSSKLSFASVLDIFSIMQEAKLEYEKARNLDPNMAEAYSGLCLWHAAAISFGSIMSGLVGADQSQVRPNCDKALKLTENPIATHISYGNALLYVAQGNPRLYSKLSQEAKGHFEQAVKIKPDNAVEQETQKLAVEALKKLKAN